MPMCDSQIGSFTFSQRPLHTETLGVCCEAENKAWIPGAKPNDYDVVCQRHLTDSDYRPIKSFWRVTFIS